jgi:hypothetical protein
MKHLFYFLLLCFAFSSGIHAQNYRMLNASSELFFLKAIPSSGNDTIYGLKCDSVNFIAGDSVFYPYRTLTLIAPVTDPCNMDAAYPTWAGTTIKVGSTNRHYWQTNSGDSVIISSLTNPGDTQNIYLYPNGDRIVGIHSVNTQMTFANITDSVKKYVLQTLTPSNTLIANYWNGKEIIISKNNGVVQMPSIAKFPTDSLMYTRVPAKRLKYGDLYPWQAGDELHELHYSLNFSNWSSTSDNYNKFILARNPITSDSVCFTIRRVTNHYSNMPPVNTIVIDTITFCAGSLSSYIETAMPQQTISGMNSTAYTYDLIYQSVDCGKLAMIDHVMNSVHVDSCVYYEMFEPFIHDNIYIEGVAGYYYAEQPHFLNSYSESSFHQTYYYIDGNSCGTPLYINVEEHAAAQFHAWPNPVADVLHLDLPGAFTGTLEVFDVSGKQIQNISIDKTNTIDVSTFADGFYFAKIISGNGSLIGYTRFVKN